MGVHELDKKNDLENVKLGTCDLTPSGRFFAEKTTFKVDFSRGSLMPG